MEKFIGIKKIFGFVFIISGISSILQTIAIIVGVIIGDYWFIDDRFQYVLSLFGLVASGTLIKLLGGSLSKINGNGYEP